MHSYVFLCILMASYVFFSILKYAYVFLRFYLPPFVYDVFAGLAFAMF